jgi:hypothetical protein
MRPDPPRQRIALFGSFVVRILIRDFVWDHQGVRQDLRRALEERGIMRLLAGQIPSSRFSVILMAVLLPINSLLAVQACGRGRTFPACRACSGSGGAELFREAIVHIHGLIARLWCWRSSHCRKASARPVTLPRCLPATRSNRRLLRWDPPSLVICAVGPHCDIRVRRYGFCGDSQ